MRKVSEYLKEERLKKGLTLENIEEETNIKKEFLEAIEEGKFKNLPSQSYALGFVKNYASFLGLPEGKTAAFFRREVESESFEIVPNYRRNQHKFKGNFFLRPQGIFTLLLVTAVLGYILFQYSSLLFGPSLLVISPREGQIFSQNVVEVKGKTNIYDTVQIEGEEVYVGYDGSFKKSLYIYSGDKKIKIVAKNRVGKTTEKEVTIKVQ